MCIEREWAGLASGLPGVVPIGSSFVLIDVQFVLVTKVMQVRYCFTGGHNQVAIGDRAFEQRTENVHGPFWLLAELP